MFSLKFYYLDQAVGTYILSFETCKKMELLQYISMNNMV